MKTETEVTGMIHKSFGLSGIALAILCACGAKVDNLPGQCSQTSDCDGGVCDTSSGAGLCTANCGDTVCGANEMCANSVCVAADCATHCTPGQTCEHLDAGFFCVQTDCFPACDVSYQECSKTVTPPVCLNTSCHPACGTNQQCAPGDGGLNCITLSVGTVLITQPAVNTLTGVSTPLAISATAGAPNGGPSKVRLAVKQQSSDAGASLELTTGNSGVYSGNVSLADAGFQTGNANVVGTVFYRFSDGGTTSVDSPAVPIQIDVDPPAFGAPVYDKAFYSGVASPAQTANVTIPINDVGPANVNPSSVILTSGTHHYPAISTAYPDGGNGNYLFAVTASDLSSSNTFLGPVPYSVTATDGVGNASTLSTGNIALDNIAPSFDSPRYDAGWYGGDAGISIAVNVQDQAGGSGLDGGSLAIAIGGITLSAPAFSGTDTYTFSTTGAAIRQGGQGPVLFNFIAADNAGNVNIIDGGQILVDEQAPTTVSTYVDGGPGTFVTSNGWVAQNGGALFVTTVATDDGGSGVDGGSISINSAAQLNSSNGTSVAGGTAYTFTVPTTVQAVGSETPLNASASAIDAVGNANALAPASDASGKATVLKIDGKPPQIDAPVLVTMPDAVDGSGVKWFNQTGGNIMFTANIVDNGSGVDNTTVQLQSASGTKVSDAVVTAATTGSTSYTFAIPRSSTSAGLIAAGAQGMTSLRVLARDLTGNTATAAIGSIGIDGQKPTVSFLGTLSGSTLTAAAQPSYPASGSNCAAGIDFCGHDPAGHFWRKGETNKLAFYGNDGSGGSGVKAAASSAGCSIGSAADCASLEYVSTDGNGTAKFDTVPNFGNATLVTSTTDGAGTVGTTVSVQDLVGNTASITIPISVTRVKWAKKMSGKVDTFTSSPIITSIPAPQIIFAGSDKNAGGAVMSLDGSGALLWRAGAAQSISAVASNVAYSSSTKLLYVVPNSGASAYAFPLTATGGVPGIGTPATCTGSGLAGSPTLISTGGAEYAMIPDDTGTFHRLTAFLVNGATCSAADSMKGGSWSSTVYTASTDGTTVFAGHDDSALSKATFTNGSFGAVVDAPAFTGDVTGNVALAASLYLGDANPTARYRAYNQTTLLPIATWPATNGVGATNSTTTQTPVVSSSFVFGSFEATHDGHLHAFDPTTGASVFTYPTTAGTKIGAISPVSIGSDNAVYFSDASNKELVALKIASNTPAVAWTFTGPSTIPISSVTTEPTIDGNGTIYFGDSAGDVFAVITDSPGTLAPTAGSNWPRVGFDNCNSGNTSLTCQ
jgi:hypothetical protein